MTCGRSSIARFRSSPKPGSRRPKIWSRRFERLADTQSLPGTLRTPDQHPPARSSARGWWSTHQLIVALCYWFMVWPTWHVHKWTGRYGVLTFLATLAIVIVGGNVRLHLWFTARTYPAELGPQLANISRIVRAADIAFSLMMIGIGLVHRGCAYRVGVAVRLVRARRRARVSGHRTDHGAGSLRHANQFPMKSMRSMILNDCILSIVLLPVRGRQLRQAARR